MVFHSQILQIQPLDYQTDLSVNDVQQLCSAKIKAENAKAIANLAENEYAALLNRLGFMKQIGGLYSNYGCIENLSYDDTNPKRISLFTPTPKRYF